MNALALLFVLAFVVSVDLRIIAPVLPSIATSLHATAGAVGLGATMWVLLLAPVALLALVPRRSS